MRNNCPDRKAIQSLNDAPAAAPKAARKAHAAPAEVTAQAKASRAKKAPKAGTKATATREGSKTSRVIEMLKREGGATLQEIMTGMGWQSHTVSFRQACVKLASAYW